MIEQHTHLSEEKLQAYHDHALDPGELQNVEVLLLECSTCQHRLDRVRRLSKRLQDLPELALPKDLSQLVVTQLREEHQLTSRLTWTLVIEALAIGLMISLFIPAFQAAGWLPKLISTRQELTAALNIFFTQLASTWIVWAAELRLLISQQVQEFLPLTNNPALPISPWILIGTAGGLGLIINYLLLGIRPFPGRNYEKN